MVGGSVAPSLGGGRLLFQFLYITLHGRRKRDSVSPSTPGLFLPKRSQTETLHLYPFSLYWPVKDHLLGTKLLLVAPQGWGHASLIYRNPCLLLIPSAMKGWGLFFLQPQTSGAPAPPGTAMPSASQGPSSHALRRTVRGLITIYQDWTFAVSLRVEDNHCQLLWKQYCVSCLLAAKNYSCI